jgi:acyl-CoA thioester hydrolase
MPMSDTRFYHPIEVRYADLDAQGHLNNAKYLTFFEQARIQYFFHLGLFSAQGSFMDFGIILADVHLAFRAPVLWGMDVRVGVRTLKLGNKSMTVAQCLRNGPDGPLMAEGEVVLVAYDYHSGATILIPEPWRETIARFEDLT